MDASTESDETDVPTLSTETLRALQEFYTDQLAVQESFVSENWQLSQFWYDDESSRTLAEEVWSASSTGDWIACLCCPSLYKSLVKLQLDENFPQKNLQIYLFEFDDRFLDLAKENFVHYDFNEAEKVPSSFFGKFNFIAADPPFLAQDCLSEIAKSCDFLKANSDSKVLLCTGEVMENSANSLLKVEKTLFVPRHQSKLSNNFASFTNYEPVVLNRVINL